MADKTKIEWTEATWNHPWHGCHKVSAGCKYCYMFRDKARYGQDPNVVVRSKTKFYDPLKWAEPRKIFTCSWSDFFIEEADPWRDEAFAIMALTPQHTYQVLTKRPDRMLEYFSHRDLTGAESLPLWKLHERFGGDFSAEAWENRVNGIKDAWPLPNVWLGVSVEDQNTADERIPLLLQTPAAVRWLSIEPILGPVDLAEFMSPDAPVRSKKHYERTGHKCGWIGNWANCEKCPEVLSENIDWVVVGGESGHEARPMHPDWARSIRDQCQAANVPFLFKQWGEWAPTSLTRDFTKEFKLFEDGSLMYKVGKKAAGRLLDGREWNEMPEVTNAA